MFFIFIIFSVSMNIIFIFLCSYLQIILYNLLIHLINSTILCFYQIFISRHINNKYAITLIIFNSLVISIAYLNLVDKINYFVIIIALIALI